MSALRFGRKVRKKAMNTSCTCREKAEESWTFQQQKRTAMQRLFREPRVSQLWDQLKVSVGAKCQGEVNEWRKFECCIKILCKTWQIGPYKRFVCNIAMLFGIKTDVCLMGNGELSSQSIADQGKLWSHCFQCLLTCLSNESAQMTVKSVFHWSFLLLADFVT